MNFIKENISLLAVSWGHFVNDFLMSVVPVVLFAFAEELSLSPFQMTVIAFVITTSGTFFQPLVGMLIDRIQKSVLLIYALTLITVGMSLSVFIKNYYLLVMVLGIAALGSSVYHPLGSTITIHKTSLSRGKSLSVFMTIGSFAHSAAPIVAIPLVTVYGLKSLSILMLPGLLSVLFLYLARVQEVTWTKEVTEDEDKRTVKLTFRQQLLTVVPMSIAVVKGLLFRNAMVFGVIILGMKGIKPVEAAGMLSVFMIARSLATLLGGFVNDAIGEKFTMIVFNTAMLIGMVLFVYGTGIWLMAGLVLLGFSINGTSSANITLIHRIMPNNVNYGTGMIMGFAGTLTAVAMLVNGLVIEKFGHMVSLNILLGLTGLVLVLSFLLPKEIDVLDYDINKEVDVEG